MVNSPFTGCVCVCVCHCKHVCRRALGSVNKRLALCMCVCGTPLSRHICPALISFAWHRDPLVSLVFNNNLDNGHLSRSEYSRRIEHSFGQNHFKVIIFLLFYRAGSREALVSLRAGARWNTNPLCSAYFGSSSVLSFHSFSLPPFSLFFQVSHCINMSCVWPKYSGPWMVSGLLLCLVFSNPLQREVFKSQKRMLGFVSLTKPRFFFSVPPSVLCILTQQSFYQQRLVQYSCNFLQEWTFCWKSATFKMKPNVLIFIVKSKLLVRHQNTLNLGFQAYYYKPFYHETFKIFVCQISHSSKVKSFIIHTIV